MGRFFIYRIISRRNDALFKHPEFTGMKFFKGLL